MITSNREYRAFEFDQKEDDMIVEGKAVAFESPTVMWEQDGIQFYEVIDRRALDRADLSDVVLVINHGGKAGAKTKNRTLALNKTDEGLFIRADLSKNATGREMHEDVKNGFYDKMSFAFTVLKDEYDKATRTRRILEIDRLYDVSLVDFPAYEQTSVSARSFYEAEAEMERHQLAEASERARKLKRLQVLVDLESEVN
jgi:uncharacterized protein